MMHMAFSDEAFWQQAEKIIASWIGTPYRHLHMVKQRGADCSLFILSILLELGILWKIEHDYYPNDWHQHTKEEAVLEGFLRHLNDNITKKYSVLVIRRDDFNGIEIGDIAAFSTVETGVSNHVSVYTGNKLMVHSINGRGVKYSVWGSFWEEALTTIFRIMKWD